MNIIKYKSKIQRITEILGSLLPMLFWMSLIFGFEEAGMAIATVCAAIIHEGGHILYLVKSKEEMNLKGVMSGFRIQTKRIMSYGQEAMLYLCGPIANITAGLVLLIPYLMFEGIFQKTIIANFLTAFSNLLPIRGYDGYGALRAMMCRSNAFNCAEGVLQAISSLLTFSFCMLSLYFIDRYGEGYWIFAIFFVSMIRDLSARLNNTKIEN